MTSPWRTPASRLGRVRTPGFLALSGFVLFGAVLLNSVLPPWVPLIVTPLAVTGLLTVRLLVRDRRAGGQPVRTEHAPVHRALPGGRLPANTYVADRPDVAAAELLGRPSIGADLGPITGHLKGRRVLVTGAGGSIGAELCRQIHRQDPAELFVLDRDESALHGLLLSIYGRARLDSPDVILADIRDPDALGVAMCASRPEVVFHAAALKHLPILERYPDEAWKTNVLGTIAVVEAARGVGVDTFVNISTDKAANPASVLGRSKRIGERVVADAAARTPGTFLSVRFGNVLGSRGSVLTTFVEQLASGRPLTVTHPDATRYVMTVSEAVGLTIHAAAIGRSGEALVLDMGEPARITELAEMLMVRSGMRVPIVFTGLRKGEKLHEDLFGDGEVGERPAHPAISHISVPPLDPSVVRLLGHRMGGRAAMVELVAYTDVEPAAEPTAPLGHEWGVL